LFERPKGGERAVLLHVAIGRMPDPADTEEFAALATSAGAEIVGEISAAPRIASPGHLVGRGKLEEIGELLKAEQAELLLVNHDLSPRQEKNMEAALKCRVLDRAGLILDIFALRARTFEGKLQVELAQLKHLSTRLVRGWTHLERQKGGIGLRGPGETQLESDRRIIGQTIKRLNKRLDRVGQRRQQGRQQRRRHAVPTVSLVGYTNAGKSTLFNRLCGADVKALDQLFATLDPTLRKLTLPGNCDIVLVDTVGFIRDLPHELIAAFKSTLEETRDARLLLHVVDCADPAHLERIAQVEEVLEAIDAGGLPVIHVYNKADILDIPPRIDRAETGMPWRVWLSAATGEGVELLQQAIAEFLLQGRLSGKVRLKPGQARLRALLYETANVTAETDLPEGGWELGVEIERERFDRLQQHESLEFFEQQNQPPTLAQN
jgi:GTP-binding protein HflX